MFTHEDNRRTLIEWATGDFKIAKVLIAKEDCVVGDHWHRNKDEKFLLLSGIGTQWIGNVEYGEAIRVREVIHVPRGTYHKFSLGEGSVLLGVGTEAFDPKDEIAGRPPEAQEAPLPSLADIHALKLRLPEDYRCDELGKIIEGGT